MARYIFRAASNDGREKPRKRKKGFKTPGFYWLRAQIQAWDGLYTRFVEWRQKPYEINPSPIMEDGMITLLILIVLYYLLNR